jgi:hypothetical protein
VFWIKNNGLKIKVLGKKITTLVTTPTYIFKTKSKDIIIQLR